MFRQYRVLNEIFLSQQALLHNYHYFQKVNPSTQIAPVLKANAYGHGLKSIAAVFDKLTSSPYFCVDSLFEAYELQKQKIKTPLLIIGYTFPQNYRTHKRLPFTFSVFDLNTLAALNKYQPGAKVHLKIDTGLTRLGIQPDNINDFIKICLKYPKLQFEGIYTHLSHADDPAKITFTRQQVKLFKRCVNHFRNSGYSFKWVHVANTAGTTQVQDPEFNLARIGLGLYGLSPFSAHSKHGTSQRKALKPALTLISHIAHSKKVTPGTSVGYGGTHKALHSQTIGILPLGYNEGLNRQLSNQAVVLDESNIHCPVVGNISMNMTAIKIPKTSRAKVGDRITVISNNPSHPNSVYAFSNLLKTIPYTVVTALHSSIRRTIV